MARGISATGKRKLNKVAVGIATLLGEFAADEHSQKDKIGRGISDALQFGGRFPAFLQMYVDKRTYCDIKKGPYNAFSEAIHGADGQLLDVITKEVRARGIKQVYSLGPTPEFDAELLKMLAGQSIYIRYVASDINPLTLFKAKEKVPGTEMTIDGILGSFESINSSEKSLVIMTGGTVSNNPNSLLEVAARIARPGGLVFADSGVTPEHSAVESAYWKQYWLSMYNSPAQRKMLINGLKKFCPDFFTAGNRSRWKMRVAYVPHTGMENWRECFITPRIQVEMRVNREMDVRWAGRDYHLLPRQTIVPVVSCKPDSASFLAKATDYGLNPIAAKEGSIDYAIRDGPKAGVISALFEVK